MQSSIASSCWAQTRPTIACRPHSVFQRRLVVRAAAEPSTRDKTATEQTIEGLSTSYCDDFVCTSSPAVEASVRQLAKDLQRCNGRWSPIYASNVEYRDAYRKFKGPEGYATLDFVPSSVQEPRVEVTTMRMLDNSAAQLRWRLTGRLGMLPIDVAGTTDITMNLLTGRIERHSESWDLSRCSPPAAAAWNAARLLWAAKRASADASKAAGHALDSLTSMDDDEGFQQRNPADPSRFFQQNDTTKQDALLFVGVLLLFWALVQAWGDLFSGNSGLGGF